MARAITVGASKSDSKSTATTDTAAGSAVAAGGDVRIDASGGPDSNLTVRGSDIRAGGDAVLKADGDINLLAARNTFETDRKSSSVSAGVGVAISVGQNGLAFGVTANASGARGRGEGRDVTWTNSHVTAGERLALESGGDTRLRGAVASGRQVVADAGGNLSIESLQDTSSFNSSDTQIGGSVTAGGGSPPAAVTPATRWMAISPASSSNRALTRATTASRSASRATPTSRARPSPRPKWR